MGSLIPLGAVCCSASCWVAVLPFVLMITVLLKKCLRNRYQLRRLLHLLITHSEDFRLFLHLGNFDVLKNLLDAFIHFAQWLANRTSIALPAFAANGHAGGNEQRTVNRLDHFERRN